jgi:rhodanese-related sulfurtransferase
MERQRITAAGLLAEARKKLPKRLSPAEALEEMSFGARLIDIRYLEQRMVDGIIPGAFQINRNELEWRLDPVSEWRDARIAQEDYQQRLIILCNQGYASSLAAAILQNMGLQNATDVDGGYQAWKEAGLPWAPYEEGK